MNSLRVLSKNPRTNTTKKYMKLENQVTSLELSQKLKELGFPQESLFYWGRQRHQEGRKKASDTEWGAWHIAQSFCAEEDSTSQLEKCSAYLASELGEMLPGRIWASVVKREGCNLARTSFCLRFKKTTPGGWRVAYYRKTKRTKEKWLLQNYSCETMSDTFAQMLIYLKENNLLT